jgi:LAS superfamily LD-carboxypeptidase LdcB
MTNDHMNEILTGRTDEHTVKLPQSDIAVHREVVPAFEKLQAAAKTAGFDLQIVSGFRDYASQLRIWNAKATGQRTVTACR